jgi:cardiolipin synthase
MWLLERVISRLRSALPFAGLCLVASSALVALAALPVGCSGATSGPGDGTDAGTVAPDADAASAIDGSAPGTEGGVPRDSGSVGNDASAGALPPMTSAVQIIVEPTDRGAALISAIQSATKSVHMTMYLLSNSSVISALISQKNAGHEVKVLLNQTFPQGGSNSASYSQLMSAGVDVHWAPTGFTLTHEKCVILDAKTAWIMTMNATQTSPSDNREYLAVDSDANDVAEAEAIFAADFANQSFTPVGKLAVAPDNARGKLVALVASAKSTVDMEAEELSDTTLVGAMTAAADRGVKVRVVIAGTGSTSQQQAIATLKQHGAKLVVVTTPYMHAKSIVVDGASAYVGSENFSTGSLSYNRELGVLTNAASEVAKVAATTSSDFASGTPL